MKRLFQKMFRDIRNSKVQFLSIFVMCFLGMLIYSGIEGVWNGMNIQKDRYFKETNLADFWVNGSNFNKEKLSDVKDIEGVTDAQLSKVTDAYTGSHNKNHIRLIANAENRISKPQVIEGKQYSVNGSGIWLDADYAKIKRIAAGDSITVYYGGNEEKLKVKGLIYSPEYISYTGSSTALMPDHSQYTYGFVSEETLTELCGDAGCNQMKLTLKSDCDTMQLKSDLKAVLSQSYINGIDRTEYSGVSGFLNKIGQIKKMSMMFSLVFLLLALLIIQTTMKRMVKQQRTQIGILKGLGFYSSQIRFHYSLYGLFISLLGVTAGLLSAPRILTPALLRLQEMLYSMPAWKGKVSCISYILAVIMVTVCTLTAIQACNKIVKELPAISLRDETMAHGKKVFLERIGFLWNSMDFDWKWSLREMFQNKARSITGVIAVLGSMVLLMASFGIRDSINTVNENIYGKQYSYYEKSNIQNMSDKDKNEIESLLQGSYQWCCEGAAEVKSKTSIKTEGLSVLDDGLYMTLTDKNGNNIRLPKEGIVLSKAVAKDLHVKKNATIEIDTGNQTVPAVVSDIIDINLQQIYMSKTAWENLGGIFSPNILFAGNTPNLKKVEHMDCVSEVTKLSDQRYDANEVLKNIKMIVILLLAVAIILSVVILYNLGILSYTERSREYATLRVLGFYNKEIKSLILKNTIINAIVGWLAGVPAGLAFLNIYVQAVSTSSIQYHGNLKPLSFMAASIITIGCSIFVSYIVSVKVGKLDMVQSLKSVE